MSTEIKRVSRNKFMDDFQIFSRRQIALGIAIYSYRKENNITLDQFAAIASIYGKPHKVKFVTCEISNYERFNTIPTVRKMNVLLAVLKMTVEDLDI